MVIPGVRRNWVAPLEFAADPRFMFGASEFVHRIDTEPGVGQRVWQRISPDITRAPSPAPPASGA
jgi:hypothetical protein